MYRKDWLVSHGKSPFAIPTSKVDKAIEELINILDPVWVKGQIVKYEDWKRENSLDEPDFLVHRELECNPLIPYLAACDKWRSSGCPIEWSKEELIAIRELANLAGGIFQFEHYWKSIPGGLGGEHVRASLQKTHLCRGMLAEILTATNYIQRGAEKVTPRFMDPRVSEDKSDIIMTWKDQEIEVHCKSKIPGAGYIVPFDIFDYWAGCFLRDTQYFGRSRHIRLELGSRITPRVANELRERFKQWIENGLVFERTELEGGIKASCKEIEIPPEGLSKVQIDKLTTRPNYRAISAWAGASDGNYHAMSIFDVVVTSRTRIICTLTNSLRKIKKQTTDKRPAIASIHLFEHLDFKSLIESPQAEQFKESIIAEIADEKGRSISAIVLTCEPKRQPLTGILEAKEHDALWLHKHNAFYRIPQELIA